MIYVLFGPAFTPVAMGHMARAGRQSARVRRSASAITDDVAPVVPQVWPKHGPSWSRLARVPVPIWSHRWSDDDAGLKSSSFGLAIGSWN